MLWGLGWKSLQGGTVPGKQDATRLGRKLASQGDITSQLRTTIGVLKFSMLSFKERENVMYSVIWLTIVTTI